MTIYPLGKDGKCLNWMLGAQLCSIVHESKNPRKIL